MIKRVTLYNFESHEDTTITFNENLNLIVGISNSGKSSLIRAMGVVVNNNWTKDMVRTGCDFCRVTLETERGWVEAERGEKVNRWRCKEGDNEIQSFKNVGTKVPDLATKILGMGERDRGGDIKELPNFQFQLEKHYMLSEIGEKKATSNMIARMMDNAIGLGGMEDLIKEISTDLLKDKKWLTEKQNEIIELKSSILDEIIFNSYTKMVDDISKFYNELDELHHDIDIADKYKIQYDNIYNIKKDNDTLLSIFSNLEDINNLKNEIEIDNIEISKLEYINGINKKLESLSSLTSLNINDMNLLKEKCEFYKKVIDLCVKAHENEKKLKDLENILAIDINELNDKKYDVDSLNSKIIKAEQDLNLARDLWKRKSSAEKEIKSINQELKNLEKEFELLKDELGVCPLCGNELKGK